MKSRSLRLASDPKGELYKHEATFGILFLYSNFSLTPVLKFAAKPTKAKPKGFALPPIVEPQPRLRYRVELKRRFIRDDSELDLGELIFTGAWLTRSDEAKGKGINQVFIFRASTDAFIERLELQEFTDDSQCVKVAVNEPLERAKGLLQQCQIISLNWEKYAG